jgi:hypothetical protein
MVVGVLMAVVLFLAVIGVFFFYRMRGGQRHGVNVPRAQPSGRGRVSTIVALVGDNPNIIPMSNPAYSAAADFSVNDPSSSTCLGSGARPRCASAVYESAEYAVPYEGTEPPAPTDYAVPYETGDAARIQPLDADGYVVDGSATTDGINDDEHGTYDVGSSSHSYASLARHSTCTSGDAGGGYVPLDEHSTYTGGSSAPIRLQAVVLGNAATRPTVATLAGPEVCIGVNA